MREPVIYFTSRNGLGEVEVVATAFQFIPRSTIVEIGKKSSEFFILINLGLKKLVKESIRLKCQVVEKNHSGPTYIVASRDDRKTGILDKPSGKKTITLEIA